ncbi:MBL fold metallo-hydrolase [Leucobacter soli]|uniref:MBL fold metallo-hydrolase n=1 Tax=Leucobacter soli TaxID=2812850 RepID=UPI003607F92B
MGDPETHEHLAAALELIGREPSDIAHIVVTHAHADHLGAADALRRLSGAELLMHEREQTAVDQVRGAAGVDVGVAAGPVIAAWGAPDEATDRLAAQLARTQAHLTLDAPADLLLHDGDRLPIAGADWRVLHTPGHTAGHICLVDGERRVILTGDHLLPTLFPGIGLGLDLRLGDAGEDDPIADYLHALESLAPYDGFDVLPGHGYRFRGLAARRRATAEHVLKRAREVAAALAADPDASIWQVARQLGWSAGWERLSSGPMLASALLQTGLHVRFVRGGGLERD